MIAESISWKVGRADIISVIESEAFLNIKALVNDDTAWMNGFMLHRGLENMDIVDIAWIVDCIDTKAMNDT